MKLNKPRLISIVILAALSVPLFFYNNCSNAKLYQAPYIAESVGGINFCTTPAQAIKTNLKYIFTFDHSGSNQQNYIFDQAANTYLPDPAGGTDPLGTKRFPPLVQFLQGITDNENTFYSSISFSDGPTQSLYWNSRTAPNPRTTNAQAVAFMNSQMPPHDGGNTDYLGALDMIKTMITRDVQAQQIAAQQGQPIVSNDYVIFFVSDGAPYVAGSLQSQASIFGSVQAIMALRAQFPDYISSITLSTGFYNTSTPSADAQLAVQFLNMMATYGQGSFINFETGSIDYTKFVVPARQAKFKVRDLWVQNASTVWSGGQLLVDKDNDGIADSIERQLGSDPTVYDTDKNGVGDGVENSVYGKPCKDATCQSSNAYVFQAQCGALPVTGYKDIDNDFLNNCEETLLGSKFDDFDSNLDWVPDQFAWINKVNFVLGSNNLQASPLNDGVTNYFKLKKNLPVDYPATSITGYPHLNYQLVQTSDDANQTCYRLDVQNLVALTSADLIRVYVMESRGATGNVRHMKVAQKATVKGALVLSDQDFTP